LRTIEIPLPPLHEQRAIAHILGTLDDKVALNRRMNETLEAMARALFKSWFVDFDPVRAKMEGRDTGLPRDIADLFPDRMVDSEMGEIPEGWEAGTLATVIELHDRKRIPLNKRQRSQRLGPYPYYGAAGIMDYVDDYLFDGVHILTGEDGSVVDARGYPIVQYVWGRFWVNNHAHVIKGSVISDEHLYLLLKHTNITAFVTGAVQPKLNQRNLKAIPLVVPAVPTCRAFSRLVAPLFARLRLNADECSVLAALRDTLLPKLMSGQINLQGVAG
jgi:type I restriction enzyme S subunit